MSGGSNTDFVLLNERMAVRIIKAREAMADLRNELHSSRPGCNCDKRGTCAYHASTFNALLEAEEDLSRAIKSLLEGQR